MQILGKKEHFVRTQKKGRHETGTFNNLLPFILLIQQNVINDTGKTSTPKKKLDNFNETNYINTYCSLIYIV